VSEERWRPLSVRRGLVPDQDGPFEGVPDHLRSLLEDWLWGMLEAGSPRFPIRVALHIRFELESHDHEAAARQLADAAGGNPDLCLDMLDAVLQLGSDEGDLIRPQDIDELQYSLEVGGSVWRVSSDGQALESRMSEAVTTATEAAAKHAGGDTERHLAAALRAAYGRHPDPRKAYSEAVHAVEAATGLLVLPSDRSATLGKIIGHMRSHPTEWCLSIRRPDDGQPEIAPLLAMMKLLWEGETGRHASGERTGRETQEAAQMAVHLAVTLVQWFTSGAVSRSAVQGEP
jgi:hypothetical protein